MPTNNLSWTPAGGAVTSQRIKRGTEPNPTTTIATVGASASTYSDTTAVAKNDYYYVVESVCANGDAVSNEVTICNDGDVSAAVYLGGITYDDTNSPYSGFILDHYSGNVYGGQAGGSNGSQAHHLVVHNPANPSYPQQFAYATNYNPTSYPYGYCDGIFGAYNMTSYLPGLYNNSVYFYIALGVERSTDGGTTKETVGIVDPSTQSWLTNTINNSTTSYTTGLPIQHQYSLTSEINTVSSTINFRPTGTDSIYYTLYPVIPTTVSPITVSLDFESNHDGSTNYFLTGSRFRIKFGVIDNNTDVHIGGCESLTGSQIAGVSENTTSETAAVRNIAFNPSNTIYVDVEAFEPHSSGSAQTTKVLVQYTVNNGSTQTLGTVYSPAYTGVSTSNTSQRLTLSRTNYQKIDFTVLVTGATDAEAAANSGGGGGGA